MNPEYEIARKAGFLPELEFHYQLYLECKYYVGILTFLAALAYAVGPLFAVEHAPAYAAVIAVPNALFVLLGIHTKYRSIPNVMKKCERQLRSAEDSGSEEATLIRAYLGAGKKKMFDEGFRTIRRSKKAVQRNPEIEVLGRGYYQEDATATSEEFAVLLHGVTIAMSRVIAIDAEAVWEAGRSDLLEGGAIAGQIFGAIARSRVESQMSEDDGPPLEVVCIGLQSSTEPSDYQPQWDSSLSSVRASRLVDEMTSKSWVWHGSYNLRIVGIDLGKCLVGKSFGSEPERRQRSAVIAFLTRDLSYERVLSFNSAIGEIMGVSAINGTILGNYDHSHDLAGHTISHSSTRFPSTDRARDG
jgi:hypothetical protein